MTKKDSGTELIVDEARKNLALDASYEIEELAMLLSKELSDRAEVGNLALIGIAKRIIGLNSIIMSVIGDESETTESIAERLP